MLNATVNNSKNFDVAENNVINGLEKNIDIVKISDNNYHLLIDNKSYRAQLVNFNREEKKLVLLINGNEHEVLIKDKTDLLLQQMGISVASSAKHNQFKAPMPGLIRSILVTVGQEIKKGDAIIVLEAMKMENSLKAPADLKVKSIHIAVGQAVEKGQLMLELE
ncbi:MAG TPA: acetyl-CoA carboxylase biotin carboxyl carrier protein subunit [Chitinophagales bacterium]